MKIFILFGVILFASCITKRTEPEYIALLDKTIEQFNDDILFEHQLICRGFGGSLMYDISQVIQHYSSVKKCDVSTTRRIVISCVEKLIVMINANQKLHPFLHQFPFPPERIEFSIMFSDEKGKNYIDGSVGHISMFNGKLYYDKYNPSTDHLEEIWQEDYSEALRIVQSEKQ